jgi:hypothetical protein
MEPITAHRCSLPFISLALICLLGCVTAQKSSTRVANPSDVDTIEHIIRADYECLSGPEGLVGKVRQKQRDDAFYMPGALFVSAYEEKGQMKSEILTPNAYWESFAGAPGHEKVIPAMYETEAGRRIERFGNVAQVRSISVARDTPNGPVKERYVNYSQLYWDGSRWWITGQVWQKETPSMAIPESWIGKWEEIMR